MEIVNVVTIAAYRRIYFTLNWLAWSKGRQPPGARATLSQTNRVKSHNGCAMMTAL